MDNKVFMLQAIDYIEDHLKEELTVFNIASFVGYSYFHFTRLFQAITGHSPKDYILKRRLTECANEILNTDKRLTDIAFLYQFNDYETFSRAFKRSFFLNPNELRKNDFHRILPYLSRITKEDLTHIERIKDIEPDIVTLDQIYIVGLQTLVRGSTSIITELWTKLSYEVKDIKNRILPEKFYEVHFTPEKYELEGFFVMCGIQTKNLEFINPLLSAKIIPKGKYLRFIHKGLSRNVGLTYRYIFQTWLPKSNYKLSIPYEFEYYGKNYLGPNHEQSESEIYIPIEIL